MADLESAAAAAVLLGLKLARSVGANTLVARADSMTMVEAMANNSGQSIVAGPIHDECLQLCLDFREVFFSAL